MRKAAILFFIFFTVAASFAQQPDSKKIRQLIQSKLDSFQKANKFPGVTFAAILPNGEKISVASGVADSVTMKPMQTKNRMLAGSIGKTFFAASVMMLAEKKTINLDDKIEKYIGNEPWFEKIPNAHSITIRMLMNHTSGIEEYYELGDFMQRLKNDPYHVWLPIETIGYIFNRKPLFVAGEGWGYADTNYLLLGFIIEKITGKKMYQFANEFALKPYQLSATEPSIKIKYKKLAVGYSNDKSPFPYHGPLVINKKFVFNPQFEWTGGGFVSSSADLAKWAKELYYYRFISAESRKEMQKGVPAKTGRNHQYGLGIQIRPTTNSGMGYGHSGWFPGYLSDAEYFPEVNISMGIQFNTDDMRQLKGSTHFYLTQMLSLIQANL